MGQQEIELNKNLLTGAQLIVTFGADGFDHEPLFAHEIADAQCCYQVADVAESLNQQQKRSEANLKLNMVLSVAASGTTPPGSINVIAALQDFSEAYGDDRNAFINDQPPMPMLPGSGPGMPPVMGGPPMGATTPPVGAGPAVPPPAIGQPQYVNNAPSQEAA